LQEAMTEQTDNTAGGSALDWAWLAAALLLLIGGLAAFYSLNTQPMPLRTLAVLAGLALGVAAFAMTAWGREVWQFAVGSRVELRKMVWPTVPDTRKTTLVVFVFVVILGLFFWAVDWMLAHGTRYLLGTGG
jgi:preprotein translocase subunit SecE